MKQFAVFGNPIKQSLSPVIHQQFAKQFDHTIEYNKQCVDIDGFKAAATAFFDAGGIGLNITAPFKLDAHQFADELTERATLAGAVNTLYKQGDKVLGDTTDGIGLVKDITDRLGWQIKGKRVLVLGAGGAVRGVLQPLLEERPDSLVIANRTVSRAEQLVETFAAYGKSQAVGFESVTESFDVVINGTSSGLTGDLPPIAVEAIKGAVCYDMVYSKDITRFNEWAMANGAEQVADGLGMLVGQAAESYRVWNGVDADVVSVLEMLRMQLAA